MKGLVQSVLLVLLALAMPAFALEPDRREVTIVSARVWDGFDYKEVFVPSTVEDLFLLSGNDSVLSFVRTQEYYWPLSRQVYVDLERMREEVPGTLRIEQNGTLVADVALDKYSIEYPDGAVNGLGRLIWGKEAETALAAYQASERAFARDLVTAQRAQTEYEHKLLEAGAARNRGETVADIPSPPSLPEPSLRLVTKPVSGYRVALEPGEYNISLVQDGAIVPGTRRALKVTDVSGRETLVADIVPEERWTRPLAANSSAARIYVRPGSIFYLTLAEATRFDESEYLPVTQPQADPAKDRAMWVRRKPSEVGQLALNWREGDETTDLKLSRFKVEQASGSGFGYTVRSALETETEDLRAFAIGVPDQPEVSRGVISTTEEVAEFSRVVILVQPRSSGIGLLLAGLPLFGFGVFAFLRRKTQSRGA